MKPTSLMDATDVTESKRRKLKETDARGAAGSNGKQMRATDVTESKRRKLKETKTAFSVPSVAFRFSQFTSFTFCFSLLLSVLAVPVFSQVPGVTHYQGSLRDKSGNPINASLPMTLSIYDTPTVGTGTQLWTENQTVGVSNGVFSISVGAVNPIPESVFASSSTYLEVDINGETPSARVQLLSGAYSFHSSVADYALTVSPEIAVSTIDATASTPFGGVNITTNTFIQGNASASNLSATNQICLAGVCQSSLANGGTLTNIVVYTSNSTWTKPANLVYIVVEVYGGGGGGGISGTCGSYIGGGGGGGSGGYALKVLASSQLGSSETVAVGLGGSSGGNGGSSSFTYNSGASTITANGGTSGTSGAAGVDGTGGSGGTSSGGDLNIIGAQGSHGTAGLCGSSMVEGGLGGNAPRGGRGGAQIANSAGAAGLVPGGGGEGGGGGSGAPGGSGAQGEVVVYQYTK